MIEEVGQKEVLEIWKVVDIRSERRTHVHFEIGRASCRERV